MKERLLCQLLALLIGYGLDLMFGDPVYSFHPIRLIGWLINRCERLVRRFSKGDSKKELIAGGILCVMVLGISTLLPLILLGIGYGIHLVLGIVIESIFCYQLLATKGLKQESMKVYRSLIKPDLEEARYHVSMIVGRDTKSLDEVGVTKAAVETVAENASDGVIAPLFYLALGGAGLGFFYKAANTLDSMVGYKNDKYLYLGRCSAKLDDVMNYIPARLSAILMVLASGLIGLNVKNAYRIWRRDSRNHASPNSAQTEAACAGALEVQLAGDAYYFGKRYKKPTIGDAIRPVVPKDIVHANGLLYMTSVLAVVIFAAVKLLIIIMIQ